SLRSRSFVTLKIYDVLGREVSTLVSEEMQAGVHAKQWIASGMPSGVYFYRLQAGTFSVTRRLLLQK
ncbi:MAG TPA: T9SS type A sorting domain-containing protein, partial [Bacteroidota bacterium]|nr:T9SS type A sorting domain-containing protein [Bacteroidota bacterium]